MQAPTQARKTFAVINQGVTYWLRFEFDGQHTITITAINAADGQSYDGRFEHANNQTLSSVTEKTTNVALQPEGSLILNSSNFTHVSCNRSEIQAAQKLENRIAYLAWFTEPIQGPLTMSPDWGPFGGPWSVPSYTRIGNVVHLSGLVKRTNPSSTSTTMCTLPEELRPNRWLILAGHSYTEALARIDITNAGEVILRAGNSTHVSLDGLSYVITTKS